MCQNRAEGKTKKSLDDGLPTGVPALLQNKLPRKGEPKARVPTHVPPLSIAVTSTMQIMLQRQTYNMPRTCQWQRRGDGKRSDGALKRQLVEAQVATASLGKVRE